MTARAVSPRPSLRTIRKALETVRPGGTLALDTPITVDQFHRILDGTNTFELVNGVIYRPVDVTIKHETAFGWLFMVVGQYVGQRKLGKVFGSRTKMRISQTSAREPDLVFVSSDKLGLLTTLDIAGAADFAIEIVESTKSRRGAVVKQAQYQDAGLPELWILDIARSQLRRFILEAGSYVELPVDPDGEIEPRAIPGLRLKVNWLFQAPDSPSSFEVVKALLGQ